MIDNEKYQIKEIEMYPSAVCFCPLGNDWYKNQFTIIFLPDKIIPDYCEIERWLDDSIRGRGLIIEDAVNLFYEYLSGKYCPKKLVVQSYVDDAKHFPVRVTHE